MKIDIPAKSSETVDDIIDHLAETFRYESAIIIRKPLTMRLISGISEFIVL